MMNPKRTATIVVVGGALLAWLAGAATSNRAIEPAPVISIPAIDNSGVALEKEISRLHERLRPTATPAQSNRNLFSFRSAPVRAVPAPNTARYTMAKAATELATAGAASGETESAVRNSP
jgi:hypothetical protein